MSKAIDFRTPYEHRIALVQNVVSQQTSLDEKASFALAVNVLQAIDHIPEQIR